MILQSLSLNLLPASYKSHHKCERRTRTTKSGATVATLQPRIPPRPLQGIVSPKVPTRMPPRYGASGEEGRSSDKRVKEVLLQNESTRERSAEKIDAIHIYIELN